MTERFQTENLFMMFKKISWNLSAQLAEPRFIFWFIF